MYYIHEFILNDNLLFTIQEPRVSWENKNGNTKKNEVGERECRRREREEEKGVKEELDKGEREGTETNVTVYVDQVMRNTGGLHLFRISSPLRR